MDSAEFTRWIAYYQLEPFGWEADNWRFGMLAAAVVNAVYATIPIPRGKPRPKPLQPSDFYPPTQKRPASLTHEQREYIRRKHGKRRNGNS